MTTRNRPSPALRQKPHLRMRHGIWVCGPRLFGFVFLPVGFVLGHGYTPAQAYWDWAEQARFRMAA
jgi:hypothetical protein